MNANKKVIWVKVKYIQENDIPVEVISADPNINAFEEAVKVIKNRPPDTRLGTGERIHWEYENSFKNIR